MWVGCDDNLPEGWVLCDGNATILDGKVKLRTGVYKGVWVNIPDFRSKFIRGAQDVNSVTSYSSISAGNQSLSLSGGGTDMYTIYLEHFHKDYLPDIAAKSAVDFDLSGSHSHTLDVSHKHEHNSHENIDARDNWCCADDSHVNFLDYWVKNNTAGYIVACQIHIRMTLIFPLTITLFPEP